MDFSLLAPDVKKRGGKSHFSTFYESVRLRAFSNNKKVL
jgi:hypothetical protein